MKKTKQIISLLLTIQMLLACALIPSAIATDSVIESSVIGSESSEELVPRVATSCTPPVGITGWSDHALSQLSNRGMGQDYMEFVFNDATPVWNSQHQSWNYTDGTATICVNSAGVVTTVYWNYN